MIAAQLPRTYLYSQILPRNDGSGEMVGKMDSIDYKSSSEK